MGGKGVLSHPVPGEEILDHRPAVYMVFRFRQMLKSTFFHDFHIKFLRLLHLIINWKNANFKKKVKNFLKNT